ncbi:multidrug resistance protein 1-like isoform X2 [Dendronephthya gigantea]|nr:multidrug resistance protein 1-like isoform X2 [Dendronephthya gigantea]
MGSMILGQTAATCFQAITSARGAAFIIFRIIDQESQIDASSNAGEKLENVVGNIEFTNIHFAYPRRPEVEVLKDFNLSIRSGTCVALVGESGCGKSTIGKLLQRFYDPGEGSVLLDGENIKDLNVSHLRGNIGVVGQEPSLFSTTIAENIAFGREGVTQYDIEKAAKIANAHDFILRFQKGYDTLCGERGTQMSGGQKQRIALARALVGNPKILVLDEATSALDSETEAAVLKAIRNDGEERTTIIIAHRLSTVRDADVIAVIDEGHVVEAGTREELMELDGLYSSLVKLQQANYDDDADEDESSFDEKHYFQISEDGAHKLASVVSTIGESQVRTLMVDNSDEIKPISFVKILKWNSPDWKFMFLGCFGAMLYGAYPFLYGITFGEVLHTMRYNPKIEEENEAMQRDADFYIFFYIVIGVESGLGIFLQNWCFSSSGEALTKRLRKRALSAVLRQDMAYFDNPGNGTGAICSLLATEVSSIQGATGPQLGLVVSALVTTVGGLIVAFNASWQLTLTMVAFFPIILIVVPLIIYCLRGNDCDKAVACYAEVVEESFTNIETIASFNRESECFAKYEEAAIAMHKKGKKDSHCLGVLAGTLMAIINLSFAVAFRLGGYLVTEKEVTLRDMMKSIFTVVLSAIVVGNAISSAPDYVKAKRAAEKLFHLFERIPFIDSYSNSGKLPGQCRGNLFLSNVIFRYPSRRNYKVLRSFDVTAQSGQTIAVIGTSGCGKTTMMSLIPRFYDVNVGSVCIDGNDVKDLNLHWLRSQIAIVSQEPVLFDMTIKENISYADTTGNLSDTDIIKAAKLANIHEFIMSLPKGYDTVVGDKGTLLSGGQKQRIAIARAMVRDPKILLFDEATSALDAESEKVVQNALRKACVGRTTIVIAHHLSTIQHADAIIVMRKGKVAEQGTHNQLLALKGIYYTLFKAQSLAVRSTF